MELTRRGFTGIATCAICAAAGSAPHGAVAADIHGFGHAGAHAQAALASDGPTPGYVTIIAEVTIEPGLMVARHTHPGIEFGYVVEGGLDLPVQGQPTRSLKPGDGFQVPAETPHAGGKNGDAKTKIVSTYVVEKGKPLASPA